MCSPLSQVSSLKGIWFALDYANEDIGGEPKGRQKSSGSSGKHHPLSKMKDDLNKLTHPRCHGPVPEAGHVYHGTLAC